MILRILVPSLALAAMAASPALRAANEPAASSTVPASSPADQTARPASNAKAHFITVDFPGGSVSDLLTAIEKTGSVFNVIGEKADLATPIPPFSVHAVTAPVLASALNDLLSLRGFNLHYNERSASDRPVYLLAKFRPDQIDGGVLVESFQLAPYLEQQSVDDIVDAIREAWGLNPAIKVSSSQLKYHRATSILLVSGTTVAINTARQVINTLKRTPDAPSNRPSPAPDAAKSK